MNLPTLPTVKPDNAEAGRLIRSKREAAGLALRRLAVRMKISAPYLCDLEQGKRNWTDALFQNALEQIKARRENK
jgi:transcriptional regulator with XRE-family HTH domain